MKDYSQTLAAVAEFVADEKRASDIGTGMGILAKINEKIAECKLQIDPLNKAEALMEAWFKTMLTSTQEKSRTIPGVGKVTLASRAGFKMTDPSAFFADLDRLREEGVPAHDVYGWFGKSINKETATAFLEKQHRLPAGVEAQPTNYVLFTRSKGA
jgi:hypothetical protein